MHLVGGTGVTDAESSERPAWAYRPYGTPVPASFRPVPRLLGRCRAGLYKRALHTINSTDAQQLADRQEGGLAVSRWQSRMTMHLGPPQAYSDPVRECLAEGRLTIAKAARRSPSPPTPEKPFWKRKGRALAELFSKSITIVDSSL